MKKKKMMKKKKKSFPDVSGDGKITKKDILMARGVIKKPGGKEMAKKDKKFIQKAIKKPGSLRKSLNVKKGEKIPASKLKAAAKKPESLDKELVLL